MSKDLLFIVDLQKGFINEHTKHLSAQVAEFINRANFADIVMSQFVNTPDGPCARILTWDKMMEGDPDTDIVDELKDYNIKIFKKNTYTALTQEVKDYILSRKTENIYLIGVDTDACVLKTAYDLFDGDIKFKIIADLCATTKGERVNKEVIELMRENIGVHNVITAVYYLTN